jgi:hypothetical protein
VCIGAFVLLASAALACGPAAAEDGASAQAASEDPFASLREALTACAEAEGMKEPSAEQAHALSEMHFALSEGPCGGCHMGATGRLTLGPDPVRFHEGMAVRHRRTHELVESCTEPGEGQNAVLRDLKSVRHKSEAGDHWRKPGASGYETSVGGVLFFTPGPEASVREQVVGLAKGAFEEPKEASDDLLESIYTWIQAGAALPPRAHVDAIVSSGIRTGAARDGSLRVVARGAH